MQTLINNPQSSSTQSPVIKVKGQSLPHRKTDLQDNTKFNAYLDVISTGIDHIRLKLDQQTADQIAELWIGDLVETKVVDEYCFYMLPVYSSREIIEYLKVKFGFYS